ncbi:MAG: hypothetical protein JWQ38_2858 [Flavipsychrobacter sp.]|nr:hypothetical protein [Flavipsychrobacter sp.]
MVPQGIGECNDKANEMVAMHMCNILGINTVKQIAKDAYLNNIADTMPLLPTLAEKAADPYILTTYLLWLYHIPPSIGDIVLSMQNEGPYTAMTKVIAADRDKFIADLLCNCLQKKNLWQFVMSAFAENRMEARPLITALAQQSNDPYILTAYLLWQNDISFSIGSLLLAKWEETPTSISVAEMTEDSKLIFLADQFCNSLSKAQLRDFVKDGYVSDLADKKLLFKKIAEQSNDVDLRTICLLWQYSIPFPLGEKMLANRGVVLYPASLFSIPEDNRTDIVLKLLNATAQENDIKLIVRKAFADNASYAHHMVSSLYEKSKNQFYKTILLLWKYKVFIPNGLIILDRVNDYCITNRNKYYIDFCIYKDIYGAIKAGVSTYKKPKPVST